MTGPTPGPSPSPTTASPTPGEAKCTFYCSLVFACITQPLGRAQRHQGEKCAVREWSCFEHIIPSVGGIFHSHVKQGGHRFCPSRYRLPIHSCSITNGTDCIPALSPTLVATGPTPAPTPLPTTVSPTSGKERTFCILCLGVSKPLGQARRHQRRRPEMSVQ